MNRRHALLATAALPWAQAKAHNDAGRVRPTQAAPALPLTLHTGRPATLPALLAGRVTALQLMFTGCSATCPIQGALFAAVQPRLQGLAGAQLLSLSIDPLGDDAPALARWLKQHGAGAAWRGGLPRVADVDRLFDYLRARGRAADRHTAQVYFFNRQGELALRSTDFPSAEQVLSWLAWLAETGRQG